MSIKKNESRCLDSILLIFNWSFKQDNCACPILQILPSSRVIVFLTQIFDNEYTQLLFIQTCIKYPRGTALQVGRSRVRFPMVPLEFFIDIILLAALWPWGRLSLYQKWVPGIFPGGEKAAGAYGWQPYHLHVPIVLKSGSLNLLEPSGPVQACNGIAKKKLSGPTFFAWFTVIPTRAFRL